MRDNFIKFYTTPFYKLDPSFILYLELADKNDSNWASYIVNKFYGDLNLPGWFGLNWNAFDECFDDLEWLNNKKIIIIHSKIKFPLQQFNNYLDTLLTSKERQLKYNQIIDIYFHEDNRLEIEAIAQQSLYE
jgi:hypothetical protein